MTRFLQSGRRRDMCVLLAAEPRQAQALKSRLETHYDERIDPKSFYAALDALEDAGFVATRTEGIHDVYALTDAGERRLQDHLDWVLETYEEYEQGRGDSSGDGTTSPDE